MYSIIQIQELLDKQIQDQHYPPQPQELYEPIRYILSLGGKRLRPALLIMACDMFGGDVQKALDPAIAIEIFHNFTLLHDDIMDKAPLRRGNVTVHEKWNDAIAILSGDAMLIRAYQSMMMVENEILKEVLQIFNETAIGVCEGQQIDMNFESSEQVTLDEYIEMIRLKTAILLGGSLKIGALIAGANATDADLLYQFGENLGLAFQMQDDILDVYGDPEKFGKQVGGDILSNKKTYLLIKARELAKGEDKAALEHWLNSQPENPAEKVNAVTEIYNRLNIKSISEQKMNNFAQTAISLLDNIQVAQDKKIILKSFAEKLLVRES